MAHTPGTWTLDGDIDRFSQGEIIFADGKPIATVYDFNRYDRDEERHANAALIAAAPILLDACKQVLEAGKELSFYRWADVFNQVRTAIAAAEPQGEPAKAGRGK